jgi:hypothetical protein
MLGAARVPADMGNLETKREENNEPHMDMEDCDGVLLQVSPGGKGCSLETSKPFRVAEVVSIGFSILFHQIAKIHHAQRADG